MLETIREYGLRNLVEHGALTGVRDLTARYFTELAARCDPLLRGPRQLEALQVLRAEYDNVLAALGHLCDTGDADGAIGLAVNLTWYWHMLGRHRDATHWLGRAVAVPGCSPGVRRDIAEGLLLSTTVTPSTLINNWSSEENAGSRALVDRLLDRPDLPGFGGALTVLRLSFLRELPATPEPVQRMIDGPDAWLAGLARVFRAHLAENRGRPGEAHEDVTAALDCFTRAGDRWGLATALPLRAVLRQYDGDLDGALADLTETTRLAREFWSLSLSDEIFINLRWIDLYVRLGDTARAAEVMATTRTRALRSVRPETPFLIDLQEAGLCLRTGDLDRAGELVDSIEAGLSDPLEFGTEQRRALAGALRSALCLALGDESGAEQALGRAYAAAIRGNDMPIAATVAVGVAGLAAHHERFPDLAVLLGAAARLRGAHDPADPQVRALGHRGRIALGDAGFAAAYRTGHRLDTSAALHRVDPALLRSTATPAGPR